MRLLSSQSVLIGTVCALLATSIQSAPNPAPLSPKVVLSYTAEGGLGNQIKYMLSASLIAREKNFSLVLADVPKRDNCSLNDPPHMWWDIAAMRKGLKEGVHVSLPSSCKSSIDLHIRFRNKRVVEKLSREKKPPIPLRHCDIERYAAAGHPKLFSKAQTIFIAGKSDWDTGHMGDLIIQKATTLFQARMASDKHRPVCVHLDHFAGRSKASRKNPAFDYIFIEPSTRARAVARKAVAGAFDKVLVFHMRLEEGHCWAHRPGHPNARAAHFSGTHICLRNDHDGSSSSSSYAQVPVAQFADALAKAVRVTGCWGAYVTHSPYEEEGIREKIGEALSKRGIKLFKGVPGDHWSTEANFAERVLASEARAFVGEHTST